MATKKCPKCGEENPAEAVMCWACYTPLAGGAAAVAGGGLVTPRGGAAAVTPAATAAAQDSEKTPVDPKIFVVVGLLVVAAVIGSFTTGLIGGKGGGDIAPPDVTTIVENPAGSGARPQQQPVFNQPTFNPPTNNPPPPQTPGGQPPIPQMRVIVPPDPRQPTGTMGIVVNTPNVSNKQAIDMAKSAQQAFKSGGKWTSMQVVVFNNPETAIAFKKYQAQRRGAGLTPYQYQDLANQGVWNSVPAYYETRGTTGATYSPSSNPRGWWARR